MTIPLTAAFSTAEIGSPRWWVDRLYAKLVARQFDIEFFDDYYRGHHPLPWLAPQAAEDFRRILEMTRTNYMGLVVDSKAERLQVEGFRVGDAEGGDKNLWRIWQANDLDSDSDQAFLEALICGSSYMLVAPNADDRSTPLITVEHPSQAIVEYEPGSRRKVAAGLKVWADEWTGMRMATLYLPGSLHYLQSSTAVSAGLPGYGWVPRGRVGETSNPLRQVPLVEIPNRPRMLTGGVSELADLTDIQDRINKTIADRLITQDFGAFPQKWAVAWPDQDEAGNPTPPIEVGRDRMVTTSVAETKFGQWDAAPLDPYSMAKREDVKDIAARSRTPAQYLLGDMSNVNGETLKASLFGLVSTIKQIHRHFGEGVERTARLALLAAGLPAEPMIETMWMNPEYITEGERTDATIKKLQVGLVSLRQGREDLGYSAAQIARLQDDDADAQADPLLERISRQLMGGGDVDPAADR